MRTIEPVAVIYTDFPCKFGIPRQSGLTGTLAKIVFEKKYRNPDAVRGLEDFSHLWLIWDFSEAHTEDFSPTVRPPRLGGNTRMGVFATRSPFRPNSLGLSCVEIVNIDLECENAPVITVRGADILSGTPVYDIKPYIPYADCIPDAEGGFASQKLSDSVEVVYECTVPDEIKDSLHEILSQDPRPHYRDGDERDYSFEFSSFRISFRGGRGIVTVKSITKL